MTYNDFLYFTLQLLSNIAFLFIAGFETTASSLAYTVYELCKNPCYEKMLIDEVDNFGRNKEITNEDLDKVPLNL